MTTFLHPQNKGPVESTASKKVCMDATHDKKQIPHYYLFYEQIRTTSKNVDEKRNDDDPSLSNKSSTSSNSGSSISGSTPQTINSDENCEPVVDSTQDIE